MESERAGEYLEAIYKRQSQKSPVSTSSLAEDLKVSLPAVTDMLKHMNKQGLVDYKPNKGTTLTDTGKKKALGLIRRHRLWERFLTDVLGMKWDKVHNEACKLEHIESPELEKGLANILGEVNTCPHGHPIPDSMGNVKDGKNRILNSFKPNQNVSIVAILKEDPQLLKNVEKLGLRPEAELKILSNKSDGSIEIEINSNKLLLDSVTAGVILARKSEIKEVTIKEDNIPLCKLRSGETGTVNTYMGKKAMLGRCLSLGFTPGSQIKMVENYNKGPVLVKIHDTSVAVGRGLAEKIMITRTENKC